MEILRLLESQGQIFAVRWIRSETEHSKERGAAAIADPLIQSMIKPVRPGSILGYFSGSSPAVSVPAVSIPVAPAPTVEEQVALFSDGACSSNGKKHAKAGFGVTVGLVGTGYREMAQMAEPLLPSESQTNQRAELKGLSKAWMIATTQLPSVLQRMGKSSTTTVHIYTDSQYSLDCILKWSTKWSKDGWRKANGEPVLHKDIIEPLFTAVKTWTNSPYKIEFHHVRSHTGKTDPLSIGNARADELATSTI